MKKILILFITVVFFAGCSISNEVDDFSFRALDYVEIPDLNNYTMDPEKLNLSTGDLNSVILMELSANEITKPVSARNIPQNGDVLCLKIRAENSENVVFQADDYRYYIDSNDFSISVQEKIKTLEIGQTLYIADFVMSGEDLPFPAGTQLSLEITLQEIREPITLADRTLICEYYNCSNLDEVYSKIRLEANKLTVYDEITNWVFANCSINGYPEQKDQYLSRVLSAIKTQTEMEGMDWESFLSEVLETNEENLTEEITVYYSEFLILKGIVEQLHISYSREDYWNQVDLLAQEYNMSSEEAREYFDPIDVYYELMVESITDSLYEQFCK